MSLTDGAADEIGVAEVSNPSMRRQQGLRRPEPVARWGFRFSSLFIYGAGSLAVLASLALAPSLAIARDVKAGDLVIRDPWIRATPNGAQVAGGYLTVINHGAQAETLTGGSLEAAARFEIHDMTNENGVMRMRPAGPLSIPPGGSVTLSPSGTHVMFTGLKHGLKKGDKIMGTLSFAHAGSIMVQFAVEGIGAKAPSGNADPAMPGMNMD